MTTTAEMRLPGPCVAGKRRFAELNPQTEACPVCPHAMLIHDEQGCYGCGPVDPETVQVWDVERGTMIQVTRAEAAAGMMRYARTLGPGSAACGEVERQAVSLLRGAS